MRVAPLLARDGGGNAPDTLVAFASNTAATGTNSQADNTPSATDVALASTAGIMPGDLLMAYDPARAGSDCTVVQAVNALVPPVAPATVAMIANPLRYAGATYSPAAGLAGYSSSTILINLGAAPTLVAFAVGTDAASGRPNVLLRHDLISGGIPAAIADNIVNLQVLYGVAATATAEPVSEWVSPTGSWAISALTDGSAPAADRLARLRGLRIALVSRSSTEEREAVSPATWALFLDVPSATVTGTLDAAGARYRYKVFESTLPLRNMLLAND